MHLENNLGSRTIDEGSLDEKSGINFSEYVAILSGNTDLLETKACKLVNSLHLALVLKFKHHRVFNDFDWRF